MKVLVTGGGGFLGSKICELLVQKGHHVFSFARNEYPHLTEMGITNIRGDITKLEDIRNATQGMDAVIHCASKVGMWGNWDDFYQINFVGTQNLINACKMNSVTKLVYTSTPSVVFEDKDIIKANESTPYARFSYSMYASTKKLAEELVLESVDVNLSVVALRPHLIWGPRDPNLIPRLLRAHYEKRLKIVGSGQNQVDVIYVDNAATAHVNALEKLNFDSNINGKVYFIGQGPVFLWDFINQIFKIYGLPKLEKKINFRLAFTIGYIIEVFLKLTKKYNADPPMTRFVALQLAKSHYFDHQYSIRDLGNYHQISIEKGLQTLK